MKANALSPVSAALMLGLISQTAQVLLLREFLMIFHGNELSMGIIFCFWLAWVGAGSLMGARVTDRYPRPIMLLGSSAGLIFLFLPATVYLIRILRGFMDMPPGTYIPLWHMALSCFLLMGPVCILLGAQFALLARIWREQIRALDSSGASGVYMAEAAGNMLGGLLFTLVLVHLLNSFQIAFAVTILMLVPCMFLLVRKNPFRPMLLVMILAVPAFFILEKLDRQAWKTQWQKMIPGHEVEAAYRSKHGDITVVRHHDQFSFFQSGHLMFSTAGSETAVPGLEEQEAAVFAHMAMVQHPDPQRILLIGGGLRGVLAEVVKHPVTEIDYLELDPVLTAAALKHVSSGTLAAMEDPRVRLIHTDPRLYVKQTAKNTDPHYDLVMVDAPDPATAVLNRYYTREFFREVKDLLSPGGVLVTSLTSTPDLRSRAVANRNASIYHTLSSVFGNVLPVGDRFMFYFASDMPDQISSDPVVLEKRYNERGIETQGFSGLHFRLHLEDSRLRRVNWIIRNHGRSPDSHLTGPARVPVLPGTLAEQEKTEKNLPGVEESYFINTDFKPIAYLYTLIFWDETVRSAGKNYLELILRIKAWWVLPLLAFPVLVTAGLRMGHGKPGQEMAAAFSILYTAFSTGFSTMVLQVALLFSFQTIYGFVYETVGLIVAMFMMGLALGAFTSRIRIRNKNDMNILALFQLIMAAAAGLMALALPLVAGLKAPVAIFVLFSGLTFAAGYINGIDFPLTTACYGALGKGADRAAGSVYGAELFGACLGAVLSGVVIVPVMGITACCILAALACGSAFMTLLISRRKYEP